MMNDKEFMKNNCNRCIKKSNENDLCNIVEKIMVHMDVQTRIALK